MFTFVTVYHFLSYNSILCQINVIPLIKKQEFVDNTTSWWYNIKSILQNYMTIIEGEVKDERIRYIY